MFRLIFPLQISFFLVNLKRKEIIIDIMPAAEGASVLSIPAFIVISVCVIGYFVKCLFLSPK